ncbi:MAG: RraA family protein [Acidimicrobiia bacterium]|nr:RraA family protein [Acidimicrobiia bacterium]
MAAGHERFTPERLAELGTRIGSSLVSDALDEAGLRHQSLPPGCAPLVADQVLVGYAFPTRLEATDEIPDVPYVGLLAALDAIGPGEVWVGATGGFRDAALWGELLSTACISSGAVGALIDGYVRDRHVIRSLGFPVLCRGADPRDINGRGEVVAHNVTVEVDGVTVAPGDLVVGDDDGVVIVPQALIDEVVGTAIEKTSSESRFRQAVREGMPPGEAFKRFGVL